MAELVVNLGGLRDVFIRGLSGEFEVVSIDDQRARQATAAVTTAEPANSVPGSTPASPRMIAAAAAAATQRSTSSRIADEGRTSRSHTLTSEISTIA